MEPAGSIGRSHDPDQAFAAGRLLGAQVRSLGFNMNFAPVLDVNSDPNNPVIGDRAFGDDADLVSTLGLAAMKGIQSQQVVSVVKHFPGHGDTSVDPHLDLPVVEKDLESLRALEPRPFQQAVRQGADAVMVAHLLLPKLNEQHPPLSIEYMFVRAGLLLIKTPAVGRSLRV